MRKIMVTVRVRLRCIESATVHSEDVQMRDCTICAKYFSAIFLPKTSCSLPIAQILLRRQCIVQGCVPTTSYLVGMLIGLV